MFKPSYESGGSIDLKSLLGVLIPIRNNFGIYFVRIIVSFKLNICKNDPLHCVLWPILFWGILGHLGELCELRDAI